MGHWMLPKTATRPVQPEMQHQAAELEELQSNASYSGSSVTQCPEAELGERVLVPYLDAKVSPPQLVELPMAEPITVQAKDLRVVNGASSSKPPRAKRPKAIGTPVFGVGTRASLGSSTPRQFTSDSEDSSIKLRAGGCLQAQIKSDSPELSRPKQIGSKQRVGSQKLSRHLSSQPLNLANKLLPWFWRAEIPSLFWCLATWRSAVVIQKLQHHGLESAQLLRDQGAQLREMALQRQGSQEELAKVAHALRASEQRCQNLWLEISEFREAPESAGDVEEMLMELALLRDDLEMTKISEEENSAAECAVLRSLRQEIQVQRQHDQSEFRSELQREQNTCQELREMLQQISDSAKSFRHEAASPSAPSPRRSLRTIVASHSHPKSEEAAQITAEELRLAENRCETLADELHVQDIMLRRIRLDEQQLQEQESHLAHQLQLSEAQAAQLAADGQLEMAQMQQLMAESEASEQRQAEAAVAMQNAQLEESKLRINAWACTWAEKLHRHHRMKLLVACAHAWWLQVHRSRSVQLSEAAESTRAAPTLAAGAAAEALRRAEARCEISRLQSQALEAELAAALQEQEQELSDGCAAVTPALSEGPEDSIRSSMPRLDPLQTVRLRQLSHWAFDGLLFLMRSAFLAWRDRRRRRQAMLKAWSSNCSLLSSSLTTLCTRALFSVWLQTTLASKGRIHFQSNRPLRPGILRAANRRTQGALQLLERVWLLRFVLTLWSAAVLAPGPRQE